MTMITQMPLPPIHDPIVIKNGDGFVMSSSWTNWFNSLYALLAPILVGSKNDADPTPAQINQINVGFLGVPQLSTAQRDTVSNPADGVMIYNLTDARFQGRQSGAWVNL